MSEINTEPWQAARQAAVVALSEYEIWLQLVRQAVTIAEAAAAQQVDRSTIMRIRTVAKEGALAALAASKPGVQRQGRATTSWRRPRPRWPGSARRSRRWRSN